MLKKSYFILHLDSLSKMVTSDVFTLIQEMFNDKS